MPPLTQYHHVGLTVTDVERSEAWYHDVLEFERLFVEPHHCADGYAVVMRRPGTSLFIGLDYHASNEGERFVEHRTGLDHLAFSVPAREHLDLWVEHLDRLGIAHSEINDRAEPFPCATLIMRDPDNIQIEFMWRDAQSVSSSYAAWERKDSSRNPSLCVQGDQMRHASATTRQVDLPPDAPWAGDRGIMEARAWLRGRLCWERRLAELRTLDERAHGVPNATRDLGFRGLRTRRGYNITPLR